MLARRLHQTVQAAITLESAPVFETSSRPDLFQQLVAREVKAVEKVHPIHKAQLLSYMKLLDIPLGLIINFHPLRLTEEELLFGQPSQIASLRATLAMEKPPIRELLRRGACDLRRGFRQRSATPGC